MQVGSVTVQPMYPLRQATQVRAADPLANATQGRPGSSVTGGAAYVEETRNAQGLFRSERLGSSRTGIDSDTATATQSQQAQRTERDDPVAKGDNTDTRRDEQRATAPKGPDGEPLSVEDLRQLEQMKATDREVRQHEMAHQVVGGQYAGSASYEYERGPDGQRYAVAGEVPVDYGPVKGDPQATIDKMQQVIAAALAPADPSPKDRQVAAQARQYLISAQLELAQQRSEMSTAREGGAGQSQQVDGSQESRSVTTDRDVVDLADYESISRALPNAGIGHESLRAVA